MGRRWAEWNFTSREGASGKGKTKHHVVFPLLRFSPPSAPFALFTVQLGPLARSQNPLEQTVFFRPSLPLKNLCLGLAGLSPFNHYSFSVFSSCITAALVLSATLLILNWNQRSAQILDSSRWTVRRMGTFGERFVWFLWFFYFPIRACIRESMSVSINDREKR